MKWLDGITDSVDTSLSKLWDVTKDRKARHAVLHVSLLHGGFVRGAGGITWILLSLKAPTV